MEIDNTSGALYQAATFSEAAQTFIEVALRERKAGPSWSLIKRPLSGVGSTMRDGVMGADPTGSIGRQDP